MTRSRTLPRASGSTAPVVRSAVAGILLAGALVGPASGAPSPAPSRNVRPAAAAQAKAEDLMGGRPFQIVLMEGQHVLMAAASTGTSLITPVPLASISKAITAMVVMQLVEEGSLDLDQTLADVLPLELVTEPWRPTTIRQLLTHQSGFSDDRTRWFNSSYDTCFEAFRLTVRRDSPTGRGSYEYSNTNFCALSLVILFTTGVSYEEATYRYVFRPLGIRRQAMDPEYTNLLGAGGWRLSALDTARIISALDPRASISPLSVASRRAMIERTTYNYGLGVWIWADDTFGHSGSLNRARNIAVHLPSGRVAVILTQASFPESGLDLLSDAESIDRAYAAACATMCTSVGPDSFLGDVIQPVRRTYL
ncbi:MAG: serine hydrolase domain-containing protein [Ilumatobacteraceae bacterium]